MLQRTRGAQTAHWGTVVVPSGYLPERTMARSYGSSVFSLILTDDMLIDFREEKRERDRQTDVDIHLRNIYRLPPL